MIFKRGFLLVMLLVFYSSSAYASLGISPAIAKVDFIPNQEYEFHFNVISDDPEREIEIYAGGSLAEYAKLSENKIVGSGGVDVRLKLPEKIDKPGDNRISIVAREKPVEIGFIATAVEIRGTIIIAVPYPGKYAEVGLQVSDGNIDSLIPVFAKIYNRGKEKLTVNLNINFYTDKSDFVSHMSFEPVDMESGSDRDFRRPLNTSGFKPGNYMAEAILNYGETVKTNQTFRIGYLFVNITNFTDKLPQTGIQKFVVGIQSRWNGDIEDVYADINISNSSYNYIFRTPSKRLLAWGEETLVGFLDTTNLNGEYDSDVIVSYSGKQTVSHGRLLVYKIGLNFVIIGVIIGGFIFVVLIIGIIVWSKRRNLKAGIIRRRGWKS